MDANVEDNSQILIKQKDFHNALSKVFPSVSKKDEISYAKLETSLRKTRSHITDSGERDVQQNTKIHTDNNSSTTPIKKAFK